MEIDSKLSAETADNKINAGIAPEIKTASVPNPAEAFKQNNSEEEAKPYYFETQTKKLKSYYLEHPQEIQNRRVLFNNSIGTVRYFGSLKHEGKPANTSNAKEKWIGIEWDDKQRGKHDGTVNGFQYFVCAEKQGSLIKYEKIQFGYRLETALFKRYFRAEELHHAKNIYESMKEYKNDFGNGKQEIQQEKAVQLIKKKQHKIQYDAQAYIGTIKKSKRIMIEFVGFDEIWTKINNLDKLHSISLAECRICDLGPSGHLNSLLKNLKQLSLEDNLLSSWDQVLQLGSELPQLIELSLTNNRIAAPTQNLQNLKEYRIIGSEEHVPMTAKQPFKNLKCLIVINTGLTWKSFFKIVAVFRNVHEFILCKNNLSDTQNIVSQRIVFMEETRFINLQETSLTSFEGVKAFSHLSNLQKLILNKNSIKQFGRNIEGFEELKHLSVQWCDIEKPVVLYQLSAFKNLESINVKHNPVGQKMGNSYVRLRAVAEMPKLATINGAALKKYERKDCQIYYMRESFREYFAFKKVPDYNYDYEDFTKYCIDLHPNVLLLIKKYGNPYEVQKKQEIQEIIKEEVKVNQTKKGTGMVDILIEYKDTGLIQKKKLPMSWTLSSLKNFFSKTIKIPVGVCFEITQLQKVTCFITPMATAQEMIEDHKTLGFFNLKAGSKIVVERMSG